MIDLSVNCKFENLQENIREHFWVMRLGKDTSGGTFSQKAWNHKGKIINGLLSKLKTKTFASQKPEFSIYVTHHFLLTYWNLMTDLDFYLTPRTETWICLFPVIWTHFIVLGLGCEALPSLYFLASFFPHSFQACLLWEISKTIYTPIPEAGCLPLLGPPVLR